jgi:hypothetical protein
MCNDQRVPAGVADELPGYAADFQCRSIKLREASRTLRAHHGVRAEMVHLLLPPPDLEFNEKLRRRAKSHEKPFGSLGVFTDGGGRGRSA